MKTPPTPVALAMRASFSGNRCISGCDVGKVAMGPKRPFKAPSAIPASGHRHEATLLSPFRDSAFALEGEPAP